MYKSTESEQIQMSFFQFNASCGMQLDTQNEWEKMATGCHGKYGNYHMLPCFPEAREM